MGMEYDMGTRQTSDPLSSVSCLGLDTLNTQGERKKCDSNSMAT